MASKGLITKSLRYVNPHTHPLHRSTLQSSSTMKLVIKLCERMPAAPALPRDRLLKHPLKAALKLSELRTHRRAVITFLQRTGVVLDSGIVERNEIDARGR
jgi:hypothetical protein